MNENIPELEIEQSEVEPMELPEGRRRVETGDQQDFGKNPATGKAASGAEEEEKPENESGKFPRAERRRKHREEQAKLKAQRQKQHDMLQQMQKPVRHGDLMQIFQQIAQYIVAPQVRKLQDQVDKLSLLPDYIAQCLTGFTVVDKDLVKLPSVEDFEEFFADYLKKLEEEQAALEKEREEAEAAAKAAQENQESNTPETEETQTE